MLGLLLSACALSWASPGPGVPLSLAKERARLISNLEYRLRFTVPASTSEPVSGTAEVAFDLAQVPEELALDFVPPPGSSFTASVPATLKDEHVLLPARVLRAGRNTLSFAFTANDGPLNRRPDLLYTLLVPARARELFPCFDQPDLKARYELALALPEGWSAVSNGAESRDGPLWRFARTEPLSTYHFAFAAGPWTAVPGPGMRLFHRESDPVKAASGTAAAFALAARAKAWMEDYTGIPQPYAKLDLVAVPGFQYGGMEHPGAVYLNARRLFLDPDATEEDRLKRASLVAHEVAHLWFGDYVTMRWFDDVWLKEVYANFLADKIVAPEFPGVDHDLRFLLAHAPDAYEADRLEEGSNPILQPLDNLKDAAALYGPIVYHKSPFVMRQLEARVGETGLRDGLRAYLLRHAWGNAAWADLVAALGPYDPGDLAAWARVWVEDTGRPRVILSEGGARQEDPFGRGRVWEQRLEPGLAYARLVFADTSLTGGAAARAVTWLSFWDDVREGVLSPEAFLDRVERTLPYEDSDLLAARLLRWTKELHARWLTPQRRAARGRALEPLLRRRLAEAGTPSLKKECFRALMRLAESAEAAAWLERVFRREEAVPGLSLDDEDEATLAFELALRRPARAEALLDLQAARLTDPDRRARFAFIRPAASPDAAVRRAFFASLKSPETRRREAWVEDALKLLNHPLRAADSLALLPEALALLPEVKRTGDIFFPSAWLEAVLSGHGSPEAAAAGRSFLAGGGPGPDARLRALCVRLLDPVFAAARARGG